MVGIQKKTKRKQRLSLGLGATKPIDRFTGKIKLMQRQKRQAAANLDQNLKL